LYRFFCVLFALNTICYRDANIGAGGVVQSVLFGTRLNEVDNLGDLLRVSIERFRSIRLFGRRGPVTGELSRVSSGEQLPGPCHADD